jgi:hypothetical protein
MVENLRMRAGDFLTITQTGNAIVVKPKRIVSADRLTEEEAKIVRRGEAQLKRGDSKPWRDVEASLRPSRPCPLLLRRRRK